MEFNLPPVTVTVRGPISHNDPMHEVPTGNKLLVAGNPRPG